MIVVSIIICTHNPRADYLTRVLEALRAQTLPLDRWELLVIDNASKDPVARRFDVSWHPHGRHIREDELGLTPARLRGIAESRADLIVFVDDDNVLDLDYLEQAERIGREYPFLGAWGGQIRPEFESEPPEWTKRFWPRLALQEVHSDRWSNLRISNQTLPCGAGMCTRRRVAWEYTNLCLGDARRKALDRKGVSLGSCGDSDLALTACDIGLGTGLLQVLRLTHLIPSGRLDEEYLLKLSESILCSWTVLQALRGKVELPVRRSLGQRLVEFIHLNCMHSRDYRFFLAEQRGVHAARTILSSASQK